MEFKRDGLKIIGATKLGGVIESSSFEANIQYEILKQLDFLNGNVIDVETAIKNLEHTVDRN